MIVEVSKEAEKEQMLARQEPKDEQYWCSTCGCTSSWSSGPGKVSSVCGAEQERKGQEWDPQSTISITVKLDRWTSTWGGTVWQNMRMNPWRNWKRLEPEQGAQAQNTGTQGRPRSWWTRPRRQGPEHRAQARSMWLLGPTAHVLSRSPHRSIGITCYTGSFQKLTTPGSKVCKL